MANKTENKQREFLTLDSLLEMSDLRQEDVFINRWQRWVTIRELSAAEVMDIRRKCVLTVKGGEDGFDSDKNLKMQIAASMVRPTVTLADVETLYAGGQAAVAELVTAVMQINGMQSGAEKEAENSFRAEPGEEVPVQAGG